MPGSPLNSVVQHDISYNSAHTLKQFCTHLVVHGLLLLGIGQIPRPKTGGGNRESVHHRLEGGELSNVPRLGPRRLYRIPIDWGKFCGVLSGGRHIYAVVRRLSHGGVCVVASAGLVRNGTTFTAVRPRALMVDNPQPTIPPNHDRLTTVYHTWCLSRSIPKDRELSRLFGRVPLHLDHIAMCWYLAAFTAVLLSQ